MDPLIDQVTQEHSDELIVNSEISRAYWVANLKLMGALLLVWFMVSLGAGILWVEQLNTIQFGGFKLGFWFAQQGSIYVFVALIFVYVNRINALETKFRLMTSASEENC